MPRARNRAPDDAQYNKERRPITFRTQSPEQYEEIVAAAAARGLSPGDYAREQAVGGAAASQAALDAAFAAGAEQERARFAAGAGRRITELERDNGRLRREGDAAVAERDLARQAANYANARLADAVGTIAQRDEQLRTATAKSRALERLVLEERQQRAEREAANEQLRVERDSARVELARYASQDALQESVLDVAMTCLGGTGANELPELTKQWARLSDEHRSPIREAVAAQIAACARSLTERLEARAQEWRQTAWTPSSFAMAAGGFEELTNEAQANELRASEVRDVLGLVDTRSDGNADASFALRAALRTAETFVERGKTEVVGELIARFPRLPVEVDDLSRVWADDLGLLPTALQGRVVDGCRDIVEAVIAAHERTLSDALSRLGDRGPLTSLVGAEAAVARWCSTFDEAHPWEERMDYLRRQLGTLLAERSAQEQHVAAMRAPLALTVRPLDGSAATPELMATALPAVIEGLGAFLWPKR
ncbi:MAG: hypothetical protein AB7G21_04350 [Dehalococcoidia bacterium]